MNLPSDNIKDYKAGYKTAHFVGYVILRGLTLRKVSKVWAEAARCLRARAM
jgi:hypothetical protein